MKIITTSFFSLLAVLGAISAISSCSNFRDIDGTWEGEPTDLAVPGLAQATYTITLTLNPGDSRSEGDVVVSATVDMTDAAAGPLVGLESPWEASVAATASMTGRYDIHDDDIKIYLSPSSLQVNVDPDGVTYRNNIADGTPSPVTDSLTAAAVTHYRVLLTAPLRIALSRYDELDDVRVRDGVMTAGMEDAQGRDIHVTFRRPESPVSL